VNFLTLVPVKHRNGLGDSSLCLGELERTRSVMFKEKHGLPQPPRSHPRLCRRHWLAGAHDVEVDNPAFAQLFTLLSKIEQRCPSPWPVLRPFPSKPNVAVSPSRPDHPFGTDGFVPANRSAHGPMGTTVARCDPILSTGTRPPLISGAQRGPVLRKMPTSPPGKPPLATPNQKHGPRAPATSGRGATVTPSPALARAPAASPHPPSLGSRSHWVVGFPNVLRRRFPLKIRGVSGRIAWADEHVQWGTWWSSVQEKKTHNH